MRLSRALAAIGTLALLALVTGCGALRIVDEPTASTTPVARSTPSPGPSQTATETELVVSTAGLGPLVIGAPVPLGAPVSWNPTACLAPNGTATTAEDGYAGLWQPTIRTAGEESGAGSAPFWIITEKGERSGAISLIQVWSSQFRTPSGLRVGSTEARVRSALPGITPQDDGSTRWYSVVAGGNRMTFSLDENSAPTSDPITVRVISVYPARYPDVSWGPGTLGGAYCPR